MALFEIPPEVMKALLTNVPDEVAPACPYAFLLDDSPAPLAPHLPWLKEQGLLLSTARRGRHDPLSDVKWEPSFAQALDIVAHPRCRIFLIQGSPHETQGAAHMARNEEVVFAQWDQTNCLLSDPLSLDGFITRLIQDIGAPSTGEEESPSPEGGEIPFPSPSAKEGEAPFSLRTDHKVIRILGVLAGAGVTLPGEGPPLKQDAAAAVLQDIFDDPQLVSDLLADLLADQLLVAEGEGLAFAPGLRPWLEALSSGEQLEVQCTELPRGEIPQQEVRRRALFLGPSGGRCLVWPVEDGSHEVILARPPAKDLRLFLAMILGDPALDADSIHKATQWACGSVTHRG